ncbi:TolC family protein [Desulfoluna limicola]|uniref:TolC family protein n=1 Tax=Desulfoluna limicola TaxID=2810562 RepID=UPI001F0227E5|nr:TolC family protein [Desulfoluna limicola]
MGRHSLKVLALSICLVCLGCSTLNRQSVSQDADVALVRELMEPVYMGQQALIDTLGATEHDMIVFRVENQSVKRVPKPEDFPQIWAQESIVFFRVNDADGGHGALHYFDPQTFRLVRLSAEAEGPDPSLAEQPHTFTLFKALSDAGRWLPGDRDLSLVRLEFEYTSSGEVRFAGKKRVRGIAGEPFLPVHLRDKGLVFFLARNENGVHSLMSVDQNGQDLKEHALGDAGEIARIYSDDGRTLVFESDKKGYQSLFRLDPDDGAITDYSRSDNEETGENPYILTSRYAYGATTPVVVKLPETMDVRNITSLVMAQNPEVSLKRALFAAALVEVGIATLPNYPSFYFEIGTVSPAGFFSNQGGFVSQTLIDGLVGLVQPLFDIKRNTELGRAARLTAETARNQLDNEINERVAEAIRLYFEIAYLNEMAAVWEELMTVYGKRASHYSTLKTVGDAYGVQLLAADRVLVAGRAQQEHNRQQMLYLKRRLKHLCGLSQGTRITLARDDLFMDEAVFRDEGELHDLAVLNHPRIKAATSELKKAYFLESAGPAVRGRLNASAEYEYTGRNTSNAVTDNINLTLSGSVSTANKKSARLHKQYWQQIKDSLRIRLGIVSGEVQLSLDEALMDFKAAKHDYMAKRANTRYYLEKARVARLYESIDTLDEEAQRDPLAVNTAVQEYLVAVGGLAEVRKDLGIRYVNVWRETGRSTFLPEQIEGFSSKHVDQTMASLWLWETKAAIGTPAGTAAFLRAAKAGNINRVYAYLYSDSRLLTEMMFRERFTLFLNACAEEGIEVWALLGEPEWLTDNKAIQDLTRGIDRIMQFNASKNRLEPKITGVKIDLEPHSIPGWETDNEVREALNTSYLRLLKRAETRIGDVMPLWVDCPVKYFSQEQHRALMRQIARLTDGITVMAYFNTPDKTINAVKTVLVEAAGPIEVGLEFSSKAPVSDTLYPMDRDEWAQVVETLSGQFLGTSEYMGLSFHDYSALKPMLNGVR